MKTTEYSLTEPILCTIIVLQSFTQIRFQPSSSQPSAVSGRTAGRRVPTSSRAPIAAARKCIYDFCAGKSERAEIVRSSSSSSDRSIVYTIILLYSSKVVDVFGGSDTHRSSCNS